MKKILLLLTVILLPVLTGCNPPGNRVTITNNADSTSTSVSISSSSSGTTNISINPNTNIQ